MTLEVKERRLRAANRAVQEQPSAGGDTEFKPDRPSCWDAPAKRSFPVKRIFEASALRPYDTVVIARGDDQQHLMEMFDLLRPLLGGLEARDWSICVMDLSPDNCITAHFIEGRTRFEHVIHTSWARQEADEFRSLVERPDNLMVLMLNQGENQVHLLLDSIANWCRMERSEKPELRAITRLFSAFRMMAQV